MAENGPKNFGWWSCGHCDAIGAWCKVILNSTDQGWKWISADHERLKSLAWLPVIVRWHYLCHNQWHNQWHMPFFLAVCFTVFLFKQREKLARCIQKDESNERKEGEQEKKKKWVVNLSTHQLTSGEKSILEKGFNFALGPRKVPNIEVIAAIEPALRDEEDQVRAERARAAIAGILRNAKLPRRTSREKNARR